MVLVERNRTDISLLLEVSFALNQLRTNLIVTTAVRITSAGVLILDGCPRAASSCLGLGIANHGVHQTCSTAHARALVPDMVASLALVGHAAPVASPLLLLNALPNWVLIEL